MIMYIVSPACAGMIPAALVQHGMKRCEPRMRGDDPGYGLHDIVYPV